MAEVARWCNHPELRPTQWNQPRPEPARVVGCEHSWCCPTCGWGQGCAPDPCWPKPGFRQIFEEEFDDSREALIFLADA